MPIMYRTASKAGAPPRASAALNLAVLSRPAYTLIKLYGDIDIATAPAMREQLVGVLKPGLRLLVLDMSEVEFCDAAVVAVLVGTQRRALPLSIVVRIAAPGPKVAKVLHITGLDRSLAIHPTVADALARPLPQRTEPARARPWSPG